MNQYHEDDTIDEMLKFMDNALDIFARRYGEEYVRTDDLLNRAYIGMMNAVRNEDSAGLIATKP